MFCRTRDATDNRPTEPRYFGHCVADLYNTVRPHSALADRTPAEAYGAGRPMDLMDNASALPTTPPDQQHQQDVINRVLAA